MRKDLLASIAMSLVIFTGVLTPVLGLVIKPLQAPVVFAQEFGPQQEGEGFSLVQPSGTFDDADAGGTNVTSPNLCAADTSFTCSFMSAVSEIIMYVPISFATISGMVFDYSVWHSIQSGTYTKYDQNDDSDASSEGLVVMGWKLVRDFTNLLFIFALFVIAFTLILDLDGGEKVTMTSNPKRTLARVLMMALLVNFSFFLGRVVIDSTNKIAIMFYSNMNKAPQIGLNAVDGDQKTAIQDFYAAEPGIHSIATRIISQINPQNFLLDADGAKASAAPGKYANLFLLSLIAAFFGLFLAYIFLSIAILFIGRTIGLYLAIIISPLAFVSYTIPFLQRQPYIGFDDWMKQFMGLAFMAPVFLFFIYIGIQFFEIQTAKGAGSVAVAAQVLFKFAMVAMFFTLAKKISKDMSGKIGDMATSFVTGALTSVAAVGAAAATGGSSAALQTAWQQTKQNARGIGDRTIGKDATDAIQQRLGGLKNFRNLPGGRGAAVAGLATLVTGSKAPGQIYDAGKEGARIGRVENFGKLRKQVSANQAADAKKKLDDAQAAKEAADRKQATRTAYNYDDRKQAQAARDTQKAAGTAPTFGDGSAKMKDSDFSAKQQERILNKAIAAEAKRGGGRSGAAPVVAATTTTTTSQAAETPVRATNTFTGDGKFDRPAEVKPSGLVDTNGQPLTRESLDAGQKLESARLARLYENAEREKKNTVHVDNLEVKNLKVNPNEVRLPSRSSNTGVTPQTKATTLLSGIQMTPRASSGALNYKAGDFSPKKPQQSTPGLDPMIQQLSDTKKEEIKKLESDKKEYNDFLKDQGPLDAKGTNVAMSVLDDHTNKIQKGYADLKNIRTSSVSGSIDQSGAVRENLPGENGNFDLGGMGPREERE